MKYKVLLTGGNQAMFDEFFVHMRGFFECQSCSPRYDDISSHLQYFEPHIVVYCMSKESKESLAAVYTHHRDFTDNKIITAIIGYDDDCNEFLRCGSYAPDLTLIRPVTAVKIQEALLKLADGRQAAWEAAKDDTAKENEPAEAPRTSSSRKHILIVDDDTRMLKLLKTYLIEQYDVATAINGKVALKFLETKKTDLILLDYEMPQGNGADILEALRLNPETANIPVVFLTGVSDSERIKKVLSMNPQGYLLKPVSRSNLFATIKNIFEKE